MSEGANGAESERSCVRYCDVHLVSSSSDCVQHVSVGAMLSIRPVCCRTVLGFLSFPDCLVHSMPAGTFYWNDDDCKFCTMRDTDMYIYIVIEMHCIETPPPSFLGAFAELRKPTISFFMSVRACICPLGTTRLSLDGFS